MALRLNKKKAATLCGGVAILLLLFAGMWQAGQGLYIMAKAELAQHLLNRAWERSLADGEPHKAWPWADAWPVAKLEAPRLGMSQIVLSNASGEALAFGPGHMSGSPMPGQGGLSVIAAHRDTHFSFLKELEEQDEIIITTRDSGSQRFTIKRTQIVNADETRIDPRAETGLALVTCYPFDARERGPLRYIAFAHPSGTDHEKSIAIKAEEKLAALDQP